MGSKKGEWADVSTVTSVNTRYDRAVRLKVEELCTEFEEHWGPGSVNRINDAVSQVPEGAALLLRELITLDYELLAADGAKPTLERYEPIDSKWQPIVRDAFRMAQDLTLSENAVTGDESPGRSQIGDYQIIREIGRGGMGVIYEAVQESLGRRVAIKTLANMHVSRLAPRFEREARAVARLHHTNIIEVYGSGVHEGVPYFAMQLVEGESLSESISQALALLEKSSVTSSGSNKAPQHPLLGPASRHHIAQIGVDVARAVQHAHDFGVLHRDIKPANLLVDRDGTTLVSDFGLARLTDEQSEMTVSGDMVGTLRYSPPESLKNEFDVRSDVYSLGVTLYELFTLKPAVAFAKQGQLLNALAHGDEIRNLRLLDPTIPIDLDTIIQKAVAREPAARYQTAGELADDLERYLADRPIHARRSGAIERGWKWAKRKPTRAALLALTTLVATVGFPLITWLWLDAIEQGNLAKNASKAARTQQAKAESASKRADLEKSLAEDTREAAVADSYRSSMQLAQSRLEKGEIAEAQRILNQWIPEATADEVPKDRRNWEWRYLNSRIDSSLVTLKSEFRYFWDVDLSRDGQLVLTVENDDTSNESPGQVVLWETMTGKKLRVIRSSRARVFQATLSPDAQSVIIVGLKNAGTLTPSAFVERWDLTTESAKPAAWLRLENLRRTEMDHTRGPRFPRAAWSPDGKYITVGLHPIVCDATTLKRVPGKAIGWAARPVFLDENRFASVNWTTFELRTLGMEEIQKAELGGHVGYLSTSNDRKLLGLHPNKPLVRIWDAPLSDPGDSYAMGLPDFQHAMITPDGKSVVRTTRNGRILFRPIHRTHQRQDNMVLTGHASSISALAFSEDGSILATAGLDGTTRIWKTDTQRVFATKQLREELAAITFAEDGTTVRYVGRQGAMQQRKKSGNSIAGSFRVDGASDDGPVHRQSDPNVTSMVHWPRSDFAFDAGGSRMVAPLSDGNTKVRVGYASGVPLGVWSADSGELLFQISDVPPTILAVCFGSDGRTLAVGGEESIYFYQLSDEGAVKTAELPVFGLVQTLELHGDWLAAGFGERTIVWRIRRDADLSPETFSDPITFEVGALDVSFAPDGDRIAIANRFPGDLHVFDLQTRQQLFKQTAPRAATCVQYNPDGTRIAVVGYDSLVSICDAENGERVLTLKGTDIPPGSFPVSARVIFSPDGRRIATNNWRGQIRVWEAPHSPE